MRSRVLHAILAVPEDRPFLAALAGFLANVLRDQEIIPVLICAVFVFEDRDVEISALLALEKFFLENGAAINFSADDHVLFLVGG